MTTTPGTRRRAGGAGPAPSPYAGALRRLARREHSEEELRRALLKKGHEAGEVEGVLRQLRSEGYLDDLAFAGRFARSRLANQGLGRYRIREALRVRGVAREAADLGLAHALSEVSEAEAVDAVARRAWRQRASNEPARRLRKVWALLLRRGFPADLVRDRLRELWPRWGREVAEMEMEEAERNGCLAGEPPE